MLDAKKLGCRVILVGAALLLAQAICLAQPSTVTSEKNSTRDTVVLHYRQGKDQHNSVAEIVRAYDDGSMLVQIPDGRLLSLNPDEVISKEASEKPMETIQDDELARELRAELGQEFRIHKTKHYVIAYNTSQIYVEWVGNLFERFYRGFNNEWSTQRHIKLADPRFPLVAIVFSDKNSYLEYAHADIGESANAMIGYYNMNTNRMVSYDMTGIDGMVPANEKISSQAVIERILSQPQAERTVATIVHEAVHQLSYNAGLQIRLADNPLWLSEGLAMYFESPDPKNPQGWKMGNINYHNYRLFLAYLNQRPADSLQTLVLNDEKFKSADKVAAAYHESWALTYFLMKTRKKEFTEYMKHLGSLEPLDERDPRARLAEFEQHFGPIAKLDKDFINYIRRLR